MQDGRASSRGTSQRQEHIVDAIFGSHAIALFSMESEAKYDTNMAVVQRG